MRLKCAFMFFMLLACPALMAKEEMFKGDAHANSAKYNQYQVNGYDIQPPVPANWHYEDCRQGDFDCMQHFKVKR